MLSNGQARQCHTGTGSWRLVHLAKNQSSLGRTAAAFFIHLGLNHFPVKVVTFTGTLADTGKHRIPTMCLGDIVDQFHDKNGLANAGTTEQADFAALCIRCEQVNNLDAGHKDFSFRGLFHKRRCILVNAALCLGLDRACFINRFADHVHDAAKGFHTDRHFDRAAGIGYRLAAHQAFGRVHGNSANGAFTKMLGNFQNQAIAAIVGFQRVQNFRQMPVELHVHDGAHNLNDLAGFSAGS